MLDITEIDPSDEAALRAFWETEQAAARADRPHPVLRPWAALLHTASRPSPYHRHTWLAARDGARTVGVAEIALTVEDNTHLAGVELGVLPGRRREGIGRALFEEVVRRCRAEGRTSICGEAFTPHDGPPAAASSYAFAVAMGLSEVHAEDHLVLPLPADPGRVAALRASAAGVASDYDVITWGERCPDEHVEAFCEMRTRMDADVPIGDVDYEPVVHTEERLRASEASVARSYSPIRAAVRRRSDGVFAGYSVLFVPHGETGVLQDDTLVMPEHRGRRLGTLLKLATLEVLAEEHPDATALHTWTAPDNHAMQRTNHDFGYRPVDRLHEMQVTGLT